MQTWRFGCVAIAVSWFGHAHAGQVTAVALDYHVHAGCPQEQDFFRELTARTRLARAAQPGDDAAPVSVQIEEVPGGSRGRLVLGAPEAVVPPREVSAVRCDQVVAAFALMTALAIDPDALTSDQPPTPPSPASTTPMPSAPPKPVAAPAARAAPPSKRTRFNAGLAWELSNAISEHPSPSVRPHIGLDREHATAFGYGFRLSGGRAHSQISRSDGAGDFTLWSARLEACPVHAKASMPVRLSACVAFEGGQLHAAGRDVTPAQSMNRPWIAVGGSLRLEFHLIPAVGVEVGGDAVFPMIRDRFFVQADSTVRRTPAVVAGGALGVSMHFP